MVYQNNPNTEYFQFLKPIKNKLRKKKETTLNLTMISTLKELIMVKTKKPTYQRLLRIEIKIIIKETTL